MEPLKETYIRGEDSVVYRVIYPLWENYYLVTDHDFESTRWPCHVFVVKGTIIEGARDCFD